MTTKHTQGPWKIWQTFYIANAFDARSRLDICMVESGNVADVQLIAAAPDMLTALESICEHANEAWAALDHDYHEVLAGNLGDAVDQARATIAKAKGESE